MDDDSKKIAQETFDKLPQDIKEVIFADDYQTILNNVAKEFNLNDEQKGKLEFETTMVLMGESTRANYPFNLESELGLDEDTAENIHKEITDTVFAEVWRSLDTLEGQGMTEEELNKKLDYEERKSEVEEGEEQSEKNSIAPDTITLPPSVALASLADRLKQASIATPSSRAYTSAKDAANAVPSSAEVTAGEASTAPRAIDPYHESIDNE